MLTYHSREVCKARKVTAKDGETVVTSSGPTFAKRGDFVVHQEVEAGENSYSAVSVWSPEAFNKAWKGTQAAKKAPQKRAQPARKVSARKPAKKAQKRS